MNWRVILTKCDLLTPVEVAKSALLVDCDLRAIVDSLRKDSSTTGSFPVSTIPIPEISLPENLPDQVSDTVDSSSSASLLDTTHTLNTDTVVGSENDNQSHMQTEVVDAPVVENEDEIDWPVYDYDCERAPALGFQYTSKSNEDNDDVYSKSNDDDENDDDGDYDAESESVNDIELGDDGNIIDQTTSNSKHNKNDKSPTTLLTYVIPVSASTGAGIRQLWDELQRVSQQSTRPISNQSLTDGNTLDSYTDSKSKDTFDGVEAAKNLMAMQKSLYGDRDLLISRSSGVSSGQMYAVREHYNAHILRKNVAQRQVQKKHRLQR